MMRMPTAEISTAGPDQVDPRSPSPGTWIPGRLPLAPLEPEWLIVDHLPLFHRFHRPAEPAADTIVHVPGFGISGT